MKVEALTLFLHRDGLLLLLAKFLRTFVYGVLTVSLSVFLLRVGFNPFQVGVILSVAVFGGLVSTVLVVLLSDHFGRRKSLSLLSLLTAFSGFILILTSGYWQVALGLFVGSISLTGGEAGPFLSLEQSILPQISTESQRNRVFSVYNFTGYAGLSLGALAGAIPGILEQERGFSLQDSYFPIFALLIFIGIALAVVYQMLGLRVEALRSSVRSRFSLPGSSRKIVFKLSGLFGLDSFGGGFVIQSIISEWFFLVFHVDLRSLGPILAAGQAITAVSILVAGPLADRFGLLNTMVSTHLASNLLLASIPFGQTLTGAVGLYLARQSLSQMDVPTRQAYTMALVPSDERTPAAGITTLSRNISQSISPAFAGYLESIPGFLGAPFLVAGSIKVLYDLVLYRTFRKVALPEQNKDFQPR